MPLFLSWSNLFIMMRTPYMRLLLTALSLFLVSFTHAQVIMGNLEFDEKKFPGRENECKAAAKAFETGDGFFMRGPVYFEQALEFYLKAQDFNSHNADLNYQIGLCYLNLNKDRLKALPFLERAQELKQDMGASFLFDLGMAYQYSLEFAKAIKVYKAYIAALGADAKPKELAKANKAIRECESGIELVKKPIRVRIDNLGPNINSKFADYAPVLSEDETKLMFTSRREGTTGNLVDAIDSMYLEDIYLSYKLDDEWAPARNAGSPLNTSEHDGTINLSGDGKTLIMYRTTGGGDIFESRMNNIAWSDPRALQEINSKDYENHAAYSTDGKTIFFISNRKGREAQGSKDIYLGDVNTDGSITNIRNAGAVVNTEYEEDGIYCHPDGKTIFFSSRGHNTMGGFDIFKSTFEADTFTKPVNLGYPVNSPEDDVFFVLSKDGKRAYFASYREEGYGEKDIYVMNFLEEVEALASIQISILDTTKGIKLKSSLEIIDKNGNVIVNRSVDTGETIANVPVGASYTLRVKTDNYATFEESLNIPFDAGNQVIVRTIEMSTEDPTRINGLLVDYSSRIPLQGEVEVKDLATSEVIKMATTDRDGKYNLQLQADKNYQIQSRSLDHRTFTDTLRLGKDMEGKEITLDYSLNKLNRTDITFLKGKIKDGESGDTISADITITEFGGIPVIVYPKPGSYDGVVSNGATYTLVAQKDGYLTYSATIEIPDSTYGRDVIHDITLLKAEKGAKMVLNNIFFDFNKSTLRPESYKTLNLLLSTLKRYPGMSIEISGHTDNVGSMSFNQKLSENRAAVVREFLIRNGIAAKRLYAVGKSFKQPIASNETDAGRQMNRRTEIKIIGME